MSGSKNPFLVFSHWFLDFLSRMLVLRVTGTGATHSSQIDGIHVSNACMIFVFIGWNEGRDEEP